MKINMEEECSHTLLPNQSTDCDVHLRKEKTSMSVMCVDMS